MDNWAFELFVAWSVNVCIIIYFELISCFVLKKRIFQHFNSSHINSNPGNKIVQSLNLNIQITFLLWKIFNTLLGVFCDETETLSSLTQPNTKHFPTLKRDIMVISVTLTTEKSCHTSIEYLMLWKPLNMITLGHFDHINWMITLSFASH